MRRAFHVSPVAALGIFVWLAFAPPAAGAIRLAVDAREAPRRVLHVRESLPARPGPTALTYPEWIPGYHTPASAINDVVNLRIRVNGAPVKWERDLTDMFTLRFDVPAGGSAVELEFDVSSPSVSRFNTSNLSFTDALGLVNWFAVLFYPAGAASDSVMFEASLTLPAGWKHATSLPPAAERDGELRFAPVTLTTLVDSPVLAGAHMRSIPLTPPGDARPVTLDIACDGEAGLEIRPADIAHMKRLVAEADALFGARHFRQYHFLYTLSDHVDHFGLEHHESTDCRSPERVWIDDDARLANAGLLPHEYAHSWNGKYRRPAGLATRDYREPMRGDLLWVYEGLTTYLGWVLTARAGLETAEESRDQLAGLAAELDASPGRAWRPLLDTGVAASLLYPAPEEWRHTRRGVDFYPEGLLIWLEADATIRRQSGGRRSLDDFCRAFFGGAGGPPALVTFTRDDVIRALERVCPFDWRGFFEQRVDAVAPRAPLGGITGGGWSIGWRDSATAYFAANERANEQIDLVHTIGLVLNAKTETLDDVLDGSPAARAGLTPGMTLLAVDGRKWNRDVLLDALRAAGTQRRPVELLAQNGEFIRTFRVEVPLGLRYPRLERVKATADLLGRTLAPRTPAPQP